MKSFILLLHLASWIVLPSLGQIHQEKQQIQTVTEQYLTAWYQGNEQKMATVVHPQMAKKIVFEHCYSHDLLQNENNDSTESENNEYDTNEDDQLETNFVQKLHGKTSDSDSDSSDF